MRRMLMVLVFLGLAALPAQAQKQTPSPARPTVQPPVQPRSPHRPHYGFAIGWYDGFPEGVAVVGTLHVPLFQIDEKVAIGAGGFGGALRDNDDPNQEFRYHWHSTAGVFFPVDVHLGKPASKWYFTVAPGYGWVLGERVKDHAPGYFAITVGFTRSF